MNKIYFLLAFSFICAPSFGQRILFVDDSGDTFFNSQRLTSVMDSIGLDYYYYDAYGLNQTPFAEEMLEFDMVIWHTSTWGTGLRLWNTNKTENPELVKYLDDPKSRLWLTGNDFMYDKYGTPPVNITSGDFAYDYLGISTYKAQSYLNDGETGLPEAIPHESAPFILNKLTWSVGNLWYADAFELTGTATPLYKMHGSDNYPLNNEITGHINRHPEKGVVVVYGFDLSLAESYEMMKYDVLKITSFLQGVLGTVKNQSLNNDVKVIPNPSAGQVTLNIKAVYDQYADIDVINIQGEVVAHIGKQIHLSEHGWNLSIDLSHLTGGVYLLRITNGNASQYQKIVIIN